MIVQVEGKKLRDHAHDQRIELTLKMLKLTKITSHQGIRPSTSRRLVMSLSNMISIVLARYKICFKNTLKMMGQEIKRRNYFQET